MAGQFIGRYRILQEVGRGGMAVVYKGEDPTLERLVAIKVLPPKFLHNPDARVRFRREAKVAARLDHPNIIKIYDVGEDEGSFHIVMEYLEGETLRDYIEQRQGINLDELFSFIRQICLALDYAHGCKVVHRDIKPENIMVINRRIIKIMDFGLAFMDNRHSVTQAGAIMGTIAYFSPEQARGELCDARSDLYSLGVIFFELLTGRLPFEATNPSDMIQKHLYAAPPTPLQFNSSLPLALEPIVEKMLKKDPFDRYQSAQDLLFELNKLAKRPIADPFGISDSNAAKTSKVSLSSAGPPQVEGSEGPGRVADPEDLVDPGRAGRARKGSKISQTPEGPDRGALKVGPEQKKPVMDETVLLEELEKLAASESQGEDLATLLKNEQLSRGALSGESWVKFRNILDKLRKDKSVIGSQLSPALSPDDTAEIEVLEEPGNEDVVREVPLDYSGISYRDAAAHLNMAQECYDTGHYREALKHVVSALTLNPKLANAHYLHGCILKEEGSLKESVDSFKLCLEIDPENPLTYEKIGEIYLGEGRYEEALKHFRQSLLLEPARPYLYCKMARAHQAWGDREESRHYLEQALRLDPNHCEALKLYGIALCQEEEWEKAVKAFETLLALDPGDLESHRLLGEIYEKTNRLSLAVEYYEEALTKAAVMDVTSKTAEVGRLHTQLGLLFERQNQWEQARIEYNEAVKNNPNDPVAHYRLADLYRTEDKIDLAIRELEQVIDFDSNQPEAQNLLGSLYLRQNNFAQAKTHLEWAVALDPFNSDSHHKLGQIYYQGDQTEQAIKECKSAISLDPYNPEYHETLGMVYYSDNDLDEAADAIQKAITLDSRNSDYHKALGVIQEGRKRFDLAIKEYEKAITINHEDALAHSLLGKAYFESGLINMAIYQYQKSASIEPRSHLVHSLLGRAYTKQGRLDLAILEFKKAVELAPRGDAKKSKQVLGKAYKHLGSVYLEQGELESALDMFKTATGLLSGDPELLRLMGNAYAENNDLDTAIPLLEEAVRKAPAYARTYLDLAVCFDLKNQTELSKKNVEKAIKLEPANRDFYEFLGELEERSGNNSSAILAFKRCLELGGGMQDNYYWRLGRLYVESGNMEEAKDAYQKAIKLNKDNWQYYSDLAQLEEELGNLRGAVELLVQAKELNPDSEFLIFINEELERLKNIEPIRRRNI